MCHKGASPEYQRVTKPFLGGILVFSPGFGWAPLQNLISAYFDEGALGFVSVYRKFLQPETSERYFDLTSQKKIRLYNNFPLKRKVTPPF